MTLIYLTATYDEKGIELGNRLLDDDVATLREYAQDAVQHINADVVEVHVTAGTHEPAFVIAGETDDEDGTLYWSNDDGWGHLSTATVFTDYERAVDHLPVNFSLDQPPRWVQLPSNW